MCLRSQPKPRTFVPTLHPWAARWNLTPNLSKVTLANILSGDTCAPISLADFERHLAFVTHSVETLQFLVWFQDYRDRYLKLPCAKPSDHDFVFRAPNLVETERRAAESLVRLAGPIALEKKLPRIPSGASTDDALPPKSPAYPPPPQYTTIAAPPMAYAAPSADANNQKLKLECSRIIATFLTPDSIKELPLDAAVRDTAIRNLSLSSHPDMFMPVYEEIYTLLERNCLPDFLSTASANINLPKQIYWYCVGVLNMSIGIILALSFIMMLPTPPEANRAWRLIPVGFFALGSAQTYSAWRGYCSQVWMRGNTQLRVWEMQEMDEEAQTFVDRILGLQESNSPRGALGDGDDSDSDRKRGPGTALDARYRGDKDVPAIAPFDRSSHCSKSIRPIDLPHPHSFRRPPVFGPEAVVQDPRIKAVHRQLMGDVVRFGVWVLLAFAAIVFSVPSRHHS